MKPEEAIEMANEEVQYLANKLELGDEVTQLARMIVQQWSQMNRLQSRAIRVNAAAAVAVACKNYNAPYTPNDVAAVMSEQDDDNAKYVARAEKDMMSQLQDELGLELSVNVPSDYVERYCEELDLPEDVAELALQVIEVAEEGDPTVFNGRRPSAGAAAAVWMASRLSGHRVSQSDVSEAANTTSVTLRDMADAVMHGVFDSEQEVEDMMLTEELDGRLNQRVERSRQRYEA